MTTKSVPTLKVIDNSVNHEDIDNELVQAGCKYLSSGAYGSVYSTADKEVVIKIFEISCNKGYLAYLDVALRHQGNPFFPVIYSVNYYYTDNTKSEGMAIVEMERLSEFEDEHGDEYGNTRQWFQKKVDPEQYSYIKEKPKTSYIKQAADYAYKAAYALKRKLQKTNEEVCTDMHGGNFMFRLVDGAQQLVITDPFV